MVEDLMECEQLCLHTHKSEVKYSTAFMRLNCKRFVSGQAIGCWVSPDSFPPAPFIMYVCHLLDQPASPQEKLLTFCTKKEKVAQLVVVQISQLLSKLQTIYLDMSRPGEKRIGFFDLRHCISTFVVGTCNCILLLHAQNHNRI